MSHLLDSQSQRPRARDSKPWLCLWPVVQPRPARGRRPPLGRAQAEPRGRSLEPRVARRPIMPQLALPPWPAQPAAAAVATASATAAGVGVAACCLAATYHLQQQRGRGGGSSSAPPSPLSTQFKAAAAAAGGGGTEVEQGAQQPGEGGCCYRGLHYVPPPPSTPLPPASSVEAELAEALTIMVNTSPIELHPSTVRSNAASQLASPRPPSPRTTG